MLEPIEIILVAIPESVGLLAAGVGLVVAAVTLRSFLGRRAPSDVESEIKKV